MAGYIWIKYGNKLYVNNFELWQVIAEPPLSDSACQQSLTSFPLLYMNYNSFSKFSLKRVNFPLLLLLLHMGVWNSLGWPSPRPWPKRPPLLSRSGRCDPSGAEQWLNSSWQNSYQSTRGHSLDFNYCSECSTRWANPCFRTTCTCLCRCRRNWCGRRRMRTNRTLKFIDAL